MQVLPKSCSSLPLHSISLYYTLVLTSRSLASLQLIQVPPADCQATLVLVHALAERVDVLSARPGLRLRRSVDLVLLLELGALGRRLGRRAAATTEPAADGMADGRSDCDTAVEMSVYVARI